PSVQAPSSNGRTDVANCQRRPIVDTSLLWLARRHDDKFENALTEIQRDYVPLQRILQVAVVTDSSNQRGGNPTCQRRTLVAAQTRANEQNVCARHVCGRLGKRF